MFDFTSLLYSYNITFSYGISYASIYIMLHVIYVNVCSKNTKKLLQNILFFSCYPYSTISMFPVSPTIVVAAFCGISSGSPLFSKVPLKRFPVASEAAVV